MSDVGQHERRVQNRVVELLGDDLDYTYLGNLKDADDNSNVIEPRLTDWLRRQGYEDGLINQALQALRRAKAVGGGRSLYDANRDVYFLLRYGHDAQVEAGKQAQHLNFIEWDDPENNDFALAEEVTVAGKHDKRPDIVLYVNGIAVAVLELKRSTVSVTEGVRQMLDNQKPEFIQPFFSTVQLVMAGNDTEGLRYSVIETPQKYWLEWKEPSELASPLDAALVLCNQARLLELIHDFIVFDAGTKKIARHNQYFGVKAGQQRVKDREGGILWHTQGSGKSLSMVWLAKWIRENVEDARVLIVTDREELDEQIEKVFYGVDEQIYRTASGADLIKQLRDGANWLLCTLVHKFGVGTGDEADYAKAVERAIASGFEARGNLFVFVDECHRTQSGKLHADMRELLPGATFIGFTGTPLLKDDKARSIEVFGSYIHTYKFDEAVEDGVILDLRYEARDIDQRITSPGKIDAWFEAKTKGLSDLAKADLKRRWGTLQKVLTAQSRLDKIVADIMFDMATRDRLMNDRGNALLVCSSIYEACKFYEAFSRTSLKHKCAIVTSYRPTADTIKGEETGEGETEALEKYATYRKMVADYFDISEDDAVGRVEDFEDEVKQKFIEQPGQMKLLIVVDKLLTGFDAPAATYLYIDKPMADHGLFQAICRVNRLDGEDKEYGCIIDYQDLFKSLESAVHVYTSGAFEDYDHEDVAGLIKNRLDQARERLDETREIVKALCEPIGQQPSTSDYLHYFCAEDSGNAQQLKANEPKRLKLYKHVGAFVRAYADLANEMDEAGYSGQEAAEIAAEVKHYENVRREVKLASGDYVDLKVYEPDMRHLLDSYIEAEDSQVLSDFDEQGLVQLIVERGAAGAIASLPEGIRDDDDLSAETIVNNVRRVIVDERPVNPKYYDRMSVLLDNVIEERRRRAFDYRQYLKELEKIAGQVTRPGGASYPAPIDSPARRALYDNLDSNEQLALAIDEAVRGTKRDGWRSSVMKQREIHRALDAVLSSEQRAQYNTEELFEIIKAQDEY
ncbi:MAG: type I restriction endonuclease subunit R [Actinobacteria bacterium]|nr:type I restriction endonuclease subunit R [Actinomycetota bacterium]